MALTYSQFIYGFEVFDSGSGSSQNNRLDFKESGTTYAATLNAGVYTAAEFAAEVKRAMNAAVSSSYSAIDCAFSFSTLKFTISGTSVFQLLFGTGANIAADCNGLLGFVGGGGAGNDKTGATSYESTDAVGSGSSTASRWEMAEPNSKVTPVGAQTDGTPATLLQREVSATQSRSDGGSVETIYKHTVKRVTIGFKALTTSEQAKMESFLDWIEQGRRFNWQPDKADTKALRLVLAEPKAINNDFTWLTRSETDYGDLTFLQQVSRT